MDMYKKKILVLIYLYSTNFSFIKKKKLIKFFFLFYETDGLSYGDRENDS